MRSRLYLLLAAVLWSTSGAAIKNCGLSGWQISFGRSLIAGLLLLAVFPEARRLPTKKVSLVALAYAGTVVLFVLASKLTTAANAIFLQDTAPLYVLLLSPFLLGEKPSKQELLAVPLFFAGLTLFFFDELSPGQVEGNALALASGVAFGSCIVGLRLLGPASMQAIALGNLFAAVISLPASLGGPSPTTLDLGLVAFLGVFQLGIPYALFAKGLTGVPALEASLLVLLEPVLNPVWTFLFAGERPGKFAIVGGAIILFATALRTVQGARAERAKRLGAAG